VPPTAAPSQPVPPEPAVLGEARFLDQAVAKLRDHDARAALKLLDQYEARFPDRSLVDEYQRVRVSTLLELKRRPAALAFLETLTLTRASEPELLVVRGELRLEANRLAAAIEDFDAVLPKTAQALRERTLMGRGLARARSGDTTRAIADYEACLRDFPKGKLAPVVSRLLDEAKHH
jgi:tetratricopeptide (TPR) repeat protein